MRLKRIEKFTSSVTKGLLPTQQHTLSQVVTGMTACRSLCLAEIARCFQTEVSFPHNLKRVWRFVSNERINDNPCKELVARRLIRQLHHRLQIKPKQFLQIIIDWTSVWPYQVLEALIPVDGRAVPVLSIAVHRSDLKCNQNILEELFIQSLRRCVPRSLRVVLVADRGFGRTELLRFISEQGFGFVIRVKGDAWVKAGRFEGKLRDYPLQVGQCFKLTDVTYHKTKQQRVKMVLNCAKIKGKVSSWLLATNLGLSARQVVSIYRERFWCEESFRDQKQEFELEKVRVERASRLENLLLALAIVLLMLAVIGMRGKNLGYADKYSTRKKKRAVISWMQIALNLLRESSRYLNLLFENKDGCFYFRWA
jgi:Transposase DDE domain